MNKYEMISMVVAMGISGGVVMTLITSWFRYREKRLDTAPRGAGAEQEQRLARIETAIEAIAVEVERIAEGQRFTTRLLTDRTGAQPPVAVSQPLKHLEERQHASS